MKALYTALPAAASSGVWEGAPSPAWNSSSCLSCSADGQEDSLVWPSSIGKRHPREAACGKREGVECLFCVPFSASLVLVWAATPVKIKLALFVRAGGSVHMLPWWTSFSLPSFNEKHCIMSEDKEETIVKNGTIRDEFTHGRLCELMPGTWAKNRAHRLRVAQ